MKKKLLFKNTTQYSKKAYDEFTRFHNKKFSFIYDFFTIFIFILLIYCLITVIKSKIVILSVLFTLILLVFGSYRILGPISFYKKEVTKKEIVEEETFTFYFYDNFIKIRDNLNFEKISYFKLHKVYETKKFFYLYLNKKYSFLIDKSGFTQRNASRFY